MDPDRLRILCLSPFESVDPGLVVAASRAGALGVLDLGRDPAAAHVALDTLARSRTPFGVRVPEGVSLPPVPDVALVILAGPGPIPAGPHVLVEVRSLAEARAAVDAGAHGVVAVGSEAGGRVGEESSFVLLQRLVRELHVPIWVRGGIGLHSAAAAIVGGARGVVLDGQLALVEECALPEAMRKAVAAMDGSETRVVNGHRVYDRPGVPVDALAPQLPSILGPGPLDQRLLPAGQDAALAAGLARRFPRVGPLVRAVARAIDGHRGQARAVRPLAAGAPLAAEHGLRVPVLQGPMTRVSDTPAFAAAVAEAGGLPFLALSLVRGERLVEMLEQTRAALGDRPWGVGMLGFAPKELRDEQLEVVRRVKPPVALLAGGRPAQARELEAEGIPTWLHVPSPGLLDLFLRDGARRFVFEGRECGGHVGPRTSFVLWEQCVDRLLQHDAAHELSIVFAGGIHDARSAAMVATLAAPLAVRGAKIGVLMGTAYLFTEEAVATGAISTVFQEAALGCEATVLVHSAPGHATRCVDSPFVAAFDAERRRLEAEGAAPEAVWEALERLNVGRLRIASKGVVRQGDALVTVDEQTQRDDGMFMIGQLAALRGEVTTIAALHDEVSAGATALLAEPTATARAPSPAVDIAIVGMAAMFPGATDLATYWSNVVLGRDAVTEVPRDRWDPARYWNDDGSAHEGGKTRSKWGGFLPRIAFDPLEYGIPPRSLAAIDPVQLLALQVARDALADAGYDRRPFDRERASVVFGAEPGTDLASAYGFRAQLPAYVGEVPEALDRVLPKLTEDSFPGVLGNVIAGRIANRLDLGGVNYTVDAACASSLAALDVGCKELAAGTSDLVLVGGADLHNAVNDYLLFDSVHALSPTGRSRPFDGAADGISLGEGVAAVVCKRLADAERDGDRIYAVIKAVAGSSDGKSLGLTAPRREGQISALERAYDRAGVSLGDVGLVEAHGTGTVVGDRTELASLTEVFTSAGVEAGRVTLGSVKSQIGHTKCAAGLAGLIKVAMALHQGVLPPSLHVQRPNPGWRPETSPFRFRSQPAPWVAAERCGGVSAFGFGGTNFHAVLASHGAEATAVGHAEWPAEVVLLRDAGAAEALGTWLDAAARPPRLADVARSTLSPGEPATIAVVAHDVAELRALLDKVRAGIDDPAILRAAPNAPAPKVAWLFPGQGSQRPNMLAELFVAMPAVRAVLAGHEALAAHLFPGDAFGPAERKAQRAALTDTRVAQPALGAVELAAVRILRQAGLAPDAVAGHSYGELVALCVAGVIPEDQLLALSALRGQVVVDAAGEAAGTMAAVRAPEDVVLGHLAGTGAVVANANSPLQTVIAGTDAQVADAAARLEAAGLEVKRFPVAAAFHSPLVAGAGPAFGAALGSVPVASPSGPTPWSNTTAAPYPTDPDAIRARLAEHLVRPVRFADQVRAMADAGVDVFVEVGPGRVLTDLVEQTLQGRPHAALRLDDQDGALVGLVRLLGALAVRGVPVDLDGLLAARGARRIDWTAPPPALSPTVWWVDGQRAVPAVGELPDNAMRLLSEPVALSTARSRDDVVLAYLDTLREQAEAQRRVMLAYLGGDGVHAEAPAFHAAAPAQVTPAPAPIAAAPLNPGELLLGIVSERTGYPAEMLDLDLDLEADLSIDSIKRVEILGALAERLGEGGGRAEQEQVVEQLAGVRTLRGILGWLDRRRAEAAAAGSVAGADLERDPSTDGDVSTDGDGIPIRTLRFVPELTPLDPPAPGSLAEARVCVAGAGALVGVVQQAIRDLGAAVVAEDEAHDQLVLVTDPEDPASGEGVYALADRLRRAFGAGVQGVCVVTWSGGRLGHADSGATSHHGVGVSGLLKTVAKEWPQRCVRRIDLDPSEAPERHAAYLVPELLDPTGPTEVGHRHGQRIGRRFLATELEAADTLALDADTVVLLTGGARGITARVAQGLADRYKCTIVMVGRSPAPPPADDPAVAGAVTDAELRAKLLASGQATTPAEVERRLRRIKAERQMRETFAALRAAGGRFEYHAADVRDAEAVRAVIDQVYQRYGRLDVVLHGAGVNEDKLLRDKTRESFVRVYDTKVMGARNLVDGLRADTRAVVFFSSVAGAFGNRGQADYAAANDALDDLARNLHGSLGARVVSIGWGPWGGGGMVTPELERQYQQRGVGVIDPDDGVERLLGELCGGQQPQVVVMAALPEQMV